MWPSRTAVRSSWFESSSIALRCLLPGMDMISEVVEALPGWFWGHVTRSWRVLRWLGRSRCHDVARAVRKDCADLDPNQQLRSGKALHQGIVPGHDGRAVDAQPF